MYPKHCQACDAICNSALQWDQHIQGTKHLKKTLNTPQSPLRMNLPVLRLSPITVSSSQYANTRPDFNFTDVSLSADDRHKDILTESVGSESLYPKHCQICNAICNSASQWDQHIQGTKHRKKTVAPQQVPVQLNFSTAFSSPMTSNVNYVYCKYCPNFVCNGTAPYEDHVRGKGHLVNVQKALANSSDVTTASSSTLNDRRQTDKASTIGDSLVDEMKTFCILSSVRKADESTACEYFGPDVIYVPKVKPIIFE